ncbi:toll-like receptor 11 [Equus quagga]|uniref:toll-like receptor 11 n=1 Tax=Equus quagga TaxID=89248 RepID=UPI001EE2D60D|nr:toll-like receptor 11 [Equus quagga]WKA14315.1 toll-like receptor 11 [Equus quagga burchellii]WKA14318.1 toll-like receptor 11 [Equus quagga boehmi]WKA14319.1 toll-like receptor 11 [Equus quagga cuninghamei]WKA14321.1 toll-like receptor 11 [Equus quagga chapmani]WKA14317.1 toll-like receptor 11 [Equus quagga burchellii]
MERPLLSFTLLSPLLLGLMSLGRMSWAWTAPDCTIADSSLLPNISYYIPFCSLAPGLHLFASCSNVKDLAQTLTAVPRDIEALCLQGTVPFLPADAFGHFTTLQLLRLQLGTISITSGTFQGLNQLQHLSFEHHAPCCLSLFLPPDALEHLRLLNTLSFHGYCLNYSQNIQLPISLRHLTVRHSCLIELRELQGLFPNLVPGSSPTTSPSPWTSFLEELDLSANLQLSQVGNRALDGLQLRSLRLDGTPLSALDLLGSGLLHLDSLSLEGTRTERLPGNVTRYFELRALDLGRNQIQNLEDEDLLSCQSLEFLSLHANGLQLLPSRFLNDLPQLQRLNLSMNKLGPTLVLPEGLVSSNLRVLDLSHNELCVLPYRAFSSLPQLQELRLSGNNISNLSSESLEGLRWLKTLDLSWNQIKTLKPGWLSSLPALTSLNLLGTHLEHISGKQLQGPQKLSHLQLGSLEMLEIYPPWPPALLSLEVRADVYIQFGVPSGEPFLFLENLTLQTSNMLLQLDNNTIHFPSLRHLTLRGCSPYILSGHQSHRFFPQLPLLEHLHFWSDHEGADDLHLFGMPSLRVLELGDLDFLCQPTSVKLEKLLKELPQLQVLALSNLNLGNLSASSFRGLGPLRLLLLNSEWALGLDSSLQELIPQMPQYVYFSDITFTCQCESSWVGPWATQAPNTFVYGLEKSMCMANASDYSKTPLLSFLSGHCSHDPEFQSFLTSFTLVFLLIFLSLLGCPKWPWLHYLQTLFHAWWWKLGGWRPRNQFHYDVFISYCEQDRAWVLKELVPALEKPLPVGEGLRLCLPERDFGVGQDRMDAMVASMESSRATLCVLSCQALGSPWCNLELRLATYHLMAKPGTARLLLLFLEPIDPRQLHSYHRLARWLQKEDYFDVSQGRIEWDAFSEKLRKRLRKAGQERED